MLALLPVAHIYTHYSIVQAEAGHGINHTRISCILMFKQLLVNKCYYLLYGNIYIYIYI